LRPIDLIILSFFEGRARQLFLPDYFVLFEW